MGSRWWLGSLVSIGLLLSGSAVLHLAVSGGSEPWLHYAIDLVLIGGAGLGFLYGGYWYATRPLTVERYATIGGWIVGAGLLFTGLGVVALYTGSEQVTTVEFLEVIHLTLSVGLLAGLLVGTLHLVSVQNAEAAARAATRADALAEERERLDRTSDLLRHYVLNSVNVISGYASLLLPAVPAEEEEKVDLIASRARVIATLIRNIRLIQGVDEGSRPTPLGPVVDAAVGKAVATDPVTVEGPDGTLAVMASRKRLVEAVSLLLDVAASVTEPGGGTRLPVDRTGETVTLTVEASPAALPSGVEAAVDEPAGSGVGLRVYLAQRLVEPFGRVTVADTAGGRVRFDVVLTAVAPP